MAQNDYFVIVYRVLKYLYDCLKAGNQPELNDPPKMVHRSTEYNCYKLEGKGNDVTVTCIHKGYAKEYENIIVKNIIK